MENLEHTICLILQKVEHIEKILQIGKLHLEEEGTFVDTSTASQYLNMTKKSVRRISQKLQAVKGENGRLTFNIRRLKQYKYQNNNHGNKSDQ